MCCFRSGDDYDLLGISDFPNEILIRIFGLMTINEIAKSVSPVCKRWNEVANDKSIVNLRTKLTLLLDLQKLHDLHDKRFSIATGLQLAPNLAQLHLRLKCNVQSKNQE